MMALGPKGKFMKKFLLGLFVVEVITILTCLAFGQVPSPSPVAVVVSTVSAKTVMALLVANLPLILLVLKSIADLAFAINPKLDAPGGVIDWAYTLVKNKLQSSQGGQK